MELLKIRFMKEVLHFILWSYAQRNQTQRMPPSSTLIVDLQEYEAEVQK